MYVHVHTKTLTHAARTLEQLVVGNHTHIITNYKLKVAEKEFRQMIALTAEDHAIVTFNINAYDVGRIFATV